MWFLYKSISLVIFYNNSSVFRKHMGLFLPFCPFVSVNVMAPQVRFTGCNLPVISKKWRQIKSFIFEDVVMLRAWAKFVKHSQEEVLENVFTVTEWL